MKSVWLDTINNSHNSKPPSFPALGKNIKTDVLIIGGGMAGILCAYFLKKAGVDYILVEGNRIGSGITKNTTAKITSQHGLIYDKLIRTAGVEKAAMYLKANQSAVGKFKELAKEFPCGLEEKSAYVYSLKDTNAIEREVRAVNSLGFPASFIEEIPLPFKTAGAVRFEKQAQFNPLEFLYGIARDLNIYENTFVKELAKNIAVTNKAKIKAERIIVATHFPFLNKHGSYFLKMYQHRSYVIALENTPDIDGMYLEETQDGLSFRNYGNLLLIGGGDHRTGSLGGKWRVLRRFAKKYYPNSIEKYTWATQDCMTLDGVPYIGRYSDSVRGLYVTTGFNKWGMTGSMVGAMILTDMVMGRKNPYAAVYSPGRSILKPQLLLNGVSAVGNLLTPTVPRCPHMGCALKWNKTEQTWDCPCHGSRFKRDGKLINNPATGDLK
ncbi:MAG: FAD-dependent oxidoreductase [Oscillospiraceae bacterium]|nr:FAD-dependent oxidoreductase [Oscillospiraceae bacterium]